MRWWRMRASEKGVMGSGRGDGQSRNKETGGGKDQEKKEKSVSQSVRQFCSYGRGTLSVWVESKSQKKEGARKRGHVGQVVLQVIH